MASHGGAEVVGRLAVLRPESGVCLRCALAVLPLISRRSSAAADLRLAPGVEGVMHRVLEPELVIVLAMGQGETMWIA